MRGTDEIIVASLLGEEVFSTECSFCASKIADFLFQNREF